MHRMYASYVLLALGNVRLCTLPSVGSDFFVCFIFYEITIKRINVINCCENARIIL